MINIKYSFYEETCEKIKKLGYIPTGCYGTTSTDASFIEEHAKKNKVIVDEEYMFYLLQKG